MLNLERELVYDFASRRAIDAGGQKISDALVWALAHKTGHDIKSSLECAYAPVDLTPYTKNDLVVFEPVRGSVFTYSRVENTYDALVWWKGILVGLLLNIG